MPINAETLLITVDVALDAARDKLKEAGAEGEGLGARFMKGGALMSVGLLAGATAAVELGKQIAESSREAEKQQNIMTLVTQALRSTHDASQMSASGIASLSDKMSGMTTFTKSAYEQANLMLLSFTHIGKNVFPQADLAAANLSTRFGIDLTQAARIVGIALDNPAQGMLRLQRYIGPLDASTKEHIKTLVAHGQAAQAQAVILDLLNTKFGGAALAAGQTFAGGMEIAKHRLEEAKVSVVSAILPALQVLLNEFNHVTEGLAEKLQPALEKFGGWMQGAASGIAPLFGRAMAGISDIWKGLQPTLAALMPSFQQLGGAIGSLIPLWGQLQGSISIFGAAGRALIPAILSLLPPLVQLAAQIGVALVGALRQIVPAIVSLVNVLIATLVPAALNLAHAVAPLIPMIGTLLVDAIHVLTPILVGVAGAIAGLVQNMQKSTPVGVALRDVLIAVAAAFTLWKVGQVAVDVANFAGSLGAMVPRLIASIPAIVAQTAAWAANAIAVLAATWPILAIGAAIVGVIAIGVLLVTHWKQVTDFVSTVWKNTLSWLAGAWQGLQKTASDVWTGIGNAIMGAIKFAINIVRGIIQDDINAIVGLWTGFSKFVSNIWSTIANTLIGWFQTAYNHSYLFQSIVDNIRNAFTLARAIITSVWNTITDFLFGIWSRELQLARDIWNGIVAVITSVVNTMRNVITTVWNAVSGFLSGVWNGIRQIAGDVWNRISGAISDYLNSQERAAHNIWDRIKGYLSGLWNDIKGIASGAWNAIHDTVLAPVQRLFNDIGHVMSGLKKAAGDWAAGMRDGLTSGISNAWGAVQRALGDIVNSIITFVKHALGIHSPSTVFMDIGRNAILGFISGFAGNDISGHLSGFIGNALGGVGGVAEALIKKGAISIAQLGSNAISQLRSWGVDVTDLLGQVAGSLGGAFAGATNIAGNIGSWLSQAIGLTGVPMSWLPALYQIAMHESGGNPSVVNRWDSNAARGTPSMGLMQTIMPTFASNAVAGHLNILNPVDNAAAAINYILRRYGSVFNVPGIVSMAHGGSYVGYDTGGWITEPVFGTGKSGRPYAFAMNNMPEYVGPSRPSQAPAAVAPIIIHVHGDMMESTAARIERERQWAARLHGGA